MGLIISTEKKKKVTRRKVEDAEERDTERDRGDTERHRESLHSGVHPDPPPGL